MNTRPALLIILLLTAPLSLAGGIYKWIDENGQVQYTQTPPPNIPAERMKGAPPPADDPEAVRGDLQRQLDALDEQRAQRDEAFAEQKQKEETARIKKQNCETARKNLAKLRPDYSKVDKVFASHLHSDHMMDYARLVHAAADEVQPGEARIRPNPWRSVAVTAASRCGGLGPSPA